MGGKTEEGEMMMKSLRLESKCGLGGHWQVKAEMPAGAR